MDRQPSVRLLLLLAVINTSMGDIHTEHHPVWESLWLPHVLSTNSVDLTPESRSCIASLRPIVVPLMLDDSAWTWSMFPLFRSPADNLTLI